MAKKSSDKSNQMKKQLKKDMAGKIASALPEIRVKLGKKKFDRRIKKATKLLTEGIHLNAADKKNSKAVINGNDTIKIEVADKAV